MAAKKKTTKKTAASKKRTSKAKKQEKHPYFTKAQLVGRGHSVTVEIDAEGAGPGHRYVRADLEFLRLDHSGVSYEGRVFLNNPKATFETPKDKKKGYAGSYQVFGHGQCFGDHGHCMVPKTYRPEDKRRPHPLERVTEIVTVTDAMRKAAEVGRMVKVTIVPVIVAATAKCDLDHVVDFKALRLVTYNA